MTPAKNKSIQSKSTAKKKISAGNKVRPLPLQRAEVW